MKQLLTVIVVSVVAQAAFGTAAEGVGPSPIRNAKLAANGVEGSRPKTPGAGIGGAFGVCTNRLFAITSDGGEGGHSRATNSNDRPTLDVSKGTHSRSDGGGHETGNGRLMPGCDGEGGVGNG